MYQRKYYESQNKSDVLELQLLTWLVQTLLKVTNAKVCASIVEARSFFASANGMAMVLKKICGTNAHDSSLIDACPVGEEFR